MCMYIRIYHNINHCWICRLIVSWNLLQEGPLGCCGSLMYLLKFSFLYGESRMFLHRLPTRELLLKRNIINPNLGVSCVLCFRSVESRNHLFFTCEFSYRIWVAVLDWLGGAGVFQSGCIDHFVQFSEMLKGKKARRVKNIIWMAVSWALWSMRNKVIFEGNVADFTFVLNQAKLLSWGWFINRSRAGRKTGVSYAAWCINPLDCLSQV